MPSRSGLEELTIRELVVELDRVEVPLTGDPGGAGRRGRDVLREQAIIAELHRRRGHPSPASTSAKAAGDTFQGGHP